MSQGIAAKVIAACLGLAGFVVAIIVGLAADNSIDTILVSAILALIGCQLVGMGIGMAAELVVRERIKSLSLARTGEPGGAGKAGAVGNSPQEVLPR